MWYNFTCVVAPRVGGKDRWRGRPPRSYGYRRCDTLASAARAGDRRLLTGAASLARIFFSRVHVPIAEGIRARGTGRFFDPDDEGRGGACQVGSETHNPCTRRAVIDLRGVPFREACVREQEAYFVLGKLVPDARKVESQTRNSPGLSPKASVRGTPRRGSIRWNDRRYL